MLIRTELSLPDDFPFDLFVTAVEGGINYWFDVRVYHWHDGHGRDDLFGFYAKGIPHDEELLPGPERMIDRETILKGIGLAMSDADVGLADRWRERIRQAVLGAPTNKHDYDADDADHVVQIGMFGEVIYG